MEFLVTSVPTMMSSIVTTQTDYKNNHLEYWGLCGLRLLDPCAVQCSALIWPHMRAQKIRSCRLYEGLNAVQNIF